ncbi:hypothetical protein KK062_09265 [Fulvivirgaceae bacterium PWU5]|uniref:Uncharacterized protein n=1 Tax=Dawidia cretensis TaxID=2782350 RepID=A0AAP2DYJ2_9BACT|nr:hypothetical protein [Dawidia cretensis]
MNKYRFERNKNCTSALSGIEATTKGEKKKDGAMPNIDVSGRITHNHQCFCSPGSKRCFGFVENTGNK